MTDPGRHTWDSHRYDRDFSFVAAYGETILGWLDPKPGERVLDLGCGTGELTARLVASGADVVGLDADTAMAQRFRERLPDVPVLVLDAQQPWPQSPPLDEPFDAVFSNAALHWMPDADGVARSMAAALREDGRLAAELGGVGNVARVQGAAEQAAHELGLPQPQWNRYYPSPAAYADVLERAGFEVRQLELADRPTRLAGPDGLADWLLLFGAGALGALTQAERAAVVSRASEIARPQLYSDGSWWADYRRLRVLARRRGAGS
jgi:trans-aconitate methyltransferase